jgi:pyruvate kinase
VRSHALLSVDVLATIGPASWDREVVAAWLRLGVTGIRFPFSKLQPRDHLARCRAVRDVADDLGAHVETIADLPGGKPRLNALGPVHVESGQAYAVTIDPSAHPVGDFWVEPALRLRFKPGDEILIGDGENRFVVTDVANGSIVGSFAVPGVIEWSRAFTPLGLDLDVLPFTERDKTFARAAHAARFDALALSYVRSADDVAAVRSWLRTQLEWSPRLIAKIETRSGVENADEIAAAADAVMVARGDLAIQIGCDELWAAQTAILRACARAGRYSIAATGFLESLAGRETPARAECIDFCATLDMGVDAILFATETALGRHPVVVVETAQRLAGAWRQSRISERQLQHALQ